MVVPKSIKPQKLSLIKEGDGIEEEEVFEFDELKYETKKLSSIKDLELYAQKGSSSTDLPKNVAWLYPSNGKDLRFASLKRKVHYFNGRLKGSLDYTFPYGYPEDGPGFVYKDSEVSEKRKEIEENSN